MNTGTIFLALKLGLKNAAWSVVPGAVGFIAIYVKPSILAVVDAAGSYDLLAQPVLWAFLGAIVKVLQFKEKPRQAAVSIIGSVIMGAAFRGAHFRFLNDIFEFTDELAINTVNSFVIGILGLVLSTMLIDTFRALSAVKEISPRDIIDTVKGWFKKEPKP